MTQEEIDFTYFREHQLVNVDFLTGTVDVKIRTKKKDTFRYAYNVGSTNQDGYIRMYCNRRLRMKHRLLFWLYHGYLPEEVDHDNSIRDDCSINNLVASNRANNTKNKSIRTYSQLTKKDVILLCADIVSGNFSITDLSKKYGRSRAQIKGILSKKYWSKVTDQYF